MNIKTKFIFILVLSLLFGFNSGYCGNITVEEAPNKGVEDVNVYIGSSSGNDGARVDNLQTNIEDKTSDKSGSKYWNIVFKKYRYIIVGFSGIATLTLVFSMLVNISKLSQHSSNPNERNRLFTAILFNGIAFTLSGSFTVFFGFFYNLL